MLSDTLHWTEMCRSLTKKKGYQRGVLSAVHLHHSPAEKDDPVLTEAQ